MTPKPFTPFTQFCHHQTPLTKSGAAIKEKAG